jgi:predicted deacylase
MAGHHAERITLARLPAGTEVATTVHTYEGAGDGPTVYVQAAQHGQEINGTEVCRRLDDRLDPEELFGRVIVVPVANPLTFDRVSYTTPEALDGVNPNMNRVWPGDADGTLHERIAARLWEFAGEADAIVDLHTGSVEMLTHAVFTESDRRARELAIAFGTELLLAEAAGEDASDEWHERRFDGKLRVAAAEAGIPAITPELAHNKQLVEDAINVGVRGVLGVLREMDALRGQRITGAEPTIARNHLGRVTADHSGLFRVTADVELGQQVPAGRRLGAVYHPTTYEPLQSVETDRAGVLYALTREATVTAGDRLASVAIDPE